MSIVAYKHGIELRAGQWINAPCSTNHGFSGRPARIKAVMPATIVLDCYRQKLDDTWVDDGESIKRKSDIRWVCDSMDEAIRMYTMSRDFAEQANELENALKLQIKALEDNIIKSAVSPVN